MPRRTISNSFPTCWVGLPVDALNEKNATTATMIAYLNHPEVPVVLEEDDALVLILFLIDFLGDLDEDLGLFFFGDELPLLLSLTSPSSPLLSLRLEALVVTMMTMNNNNNDDVYNSTV